MNLPKAIMSFGLGYITGTLGMEILIFNNPRPNVVFTFGLAIAVFVIFLSGSYIEK
jgi:hypothetical protein